MSGYTNDLLRKVLALDTEDAAITAIDNTGDQMADKIRDQLTHGINAQGEPIGVYKNPDYAFAKHRLNPLPGQGYVDEKLSGAYHEGIYAAIVGDELIVESTDPKNRELENKYGEPGLAGEFKEKYIREDLSPEYISIIASRIGLKVN